MTPYEQARQVYQTEPCVRSFDEDLMWHLRGGFVFSTPDFFVMGRPVDSKAEPGLIVNPSWQFKREECDCWHVYLMAGSIARAWSILPHPLPLMSFERGNVLRFHRLSSLMRASGIHPITTP